MGIVLFTGADVQLGTLFLQQSGDRHTLRLTYLDQSIDAPEHEVVQLDVTNFEATL